MTTLLVNFTESEKQGRRFIYTDYEDIVVYKENENDRLVFVKEVNHKKNLSSLNIKMELKGKRTKEELLEAIEKRDRKIIREEKARKALIKRDFRKVLNLVRYSKKYEQLLSIYERIYNEEKRNEILKTLITFKKINKSPYSNSFYDSDNIDWDSKPEGSLRLSDHWNFYSWGEQHCCLDCTDEYTQKWLLCQYQNGVYHVVKEL
jgi:hypothetical protein